MGAMGTQFKQLLQKTSHRISERNNQPYPLVMNRIRTKIVSVLMKQNAKAILSAIDL